MSPVAPARQAFHGWKILGLATYSQFVSVGFTVYLLGIYIEPLSRAFSATPGQLGWAATILTITGAAIGPLLGHWVDRGHARVMLAAGALLMTLAFGWLAQSGSLVQAALACVLLSVGAGLAGIVPATALVIRWFYRRRGFAVGVAAAGISLGGFVMPPVAAALVVHLDWRTSMLVLAGLIALTLAPAAWALAVGKPEDIGQFPDGAAEPPPAVDGLRDPAFGFAWLFGQRCFWVLCVAVGLLAFCNIVIITFLVPFARERGMDPQLGALMLSVYAGCGLGGKFAWGWLCDRFPPRRMMTALLLAAALGWLPMLAWPGPGAMIATAVLAGGGAGGLVPVWAALISVYFGAEAFGRVKGTMSLVLVALTILPGPLGGYLRDLHGSYQMSFSLLWWVLPVAVAASLLLPRPSPAPVAAGGTP